MKTKLFKPTEQELLEMGFVEDLEDWILHIDPPIEYFETLGDGMRWTMGDRTIYPTSKSDIECLIKLLTP